MKKKKESLWKLLQRLDEEAGQFNMHLHQANRYFDNAAGTTKKLLTKHEKDLHKVIGKFRQTLRSWQKQSKRNTGNNKKTT
jgi:hypothetical protein